MRRLPYLFLTLCFLFYFSCKPNTSHVENKVTIDPGWKKIPDSWIKKALSFNYKRTDTSLISEFAKLIAPDTLYNPHAEHVDPNYGRVFNTLSVDLDGDQQNEVLCLQGWDVYYPYLCAFKQVNNSWYLIYKEEIETFNCSPTLCLANNYSKNKTFYLRRVDNYGSDIYIDSYSFYKLANNKVYKCLNVINEANIYGWGLYMNQSVKSSFEFRGDSEDDLFVNYTYNFFPGGIYKSDCPWCAHDDMPLIQGDDGVDYVYDNKTHQYKLDIQNYKNSATDLTAEKIKCFAAFGNDSLIVKAFSRHIDTILKIGTPVQKKVLRKYLSLVAKNKTARTEEMEVKTQAGGTTFYGPKKKE